MKMSRDDFEKTLARLEIYEKIAEAEAQILNGVELLDGIEVFEKLREKYIKR